MLRNSNILWGLLLIALGALFLSQNFGLLPELDFIWPFIFAAVGIGFLALYVLNREQWWALIPGFVLLGLAAVTGVDLLRLDVPDDWGGAFFLGMIGLGFLAVYLVRRDNWWAIIPGGVLLTLAMVAFLSNRPEIETGSLFFFGLALTFGLLFLLTRMRWALIPAGALAVLAVVIFVGFGAMIDYIWPVALIAAGLFLIIRVVRRPA